ncbi:hypothetical protein [Yellowstone lake phycodnavirus 2]|uniref:hypothetical protein n=1 Tax=Yellowstone lake phycodnavirus 2 TaxID=1586714 RepID=UPI0006EB87C6|nr:hypothetical protein AR678_gp075 [Yellowstone lake phycodnavirus 2]BAT22349.1 hypothetical protein [Yellowstone lake phycodnavirus 2]
MILLSSEFPINTCQEKVQSSGGLLAVNLVSLAQKWPLNERKALDLQLLLRLGHGHDPWVLLLGLGLVLADNLTSLAALFQVLLHEATCGVVSVTVHNLGAGADSLGMGHFEIYGD